MAEKLAKKAILEKTMEKTPIETPIETPIKTPIKVLKILALNPNITIPELAQQIDKSESATWRTVRKLQKEGRIKRIGSKKGGHWEVIKRDEE